MTAQNFFSRYLPIEPSLVEWGMYVLDAGRTEVPAGSDYPIGGHPEEYLFSWTKGRVLNEYQMIYLTHGSGVFEWQGGKRVTVRSGDLMLLRPGVWHRYKPDAGVGWTENWIGFQGEYAQRLVEKFFPPKNALLKCGYDEELLRKMQYVVQLMREMPPGFRQMMAGETVAALAMVRSLAMQSNKALNSQEEKMDRARSYLLVHAVDKIDLSELASELGMSYSRFRVLFRKHTGSSPHKYQLDIQINRSKDLLKESTHSVTQIAEMLGFSSVYYFSRLFKQRVGKTPVEFRKEAGG